MINPYWELAILLVLINIIFAQSLNLIIGYNGQFALGHAGFLAIGAYTSAVLVIHLHIPLFLAVVAASVLTAFFGLLIGYPCLRLRGDYLAIATLGFAEIIRIVLLALPSDIFGGPTGIRNAPNIKEFLPPTGSINGLMNLIFTVLFALVAVALLFWGIYAFAGFLVPSSSVSGDYYLHRAHRPRFPGYLPVPAGFQRRQCEEHPMGGVPALRRDSRPGAACIA
jgi:ABC-type branched-subunit amino acid transport system permease subunit